MLKKYLVGHAREEETKVVDNWFESFEAQAPVSLTTEERETTGQEIWGRIERSLAEKPGRVIPMYRKVAASAAIVVGIVCTVLLLKNNDKKDDCNGQPCYTTIVTGNQERKTITIKDGTQLVLNAGSTIHIYDDFSENRKLDLVDGEVFFEVKKDPQRPFIIHSGALTVTVLGTSFNISAYKELNEVSVGVVTGKVNVTKNDTTLGILEKTQELVYHKQQQQAEIVTMHNELLAWKEGRLVLNDASFNEMTFFMKKVFGLEILTEDKDISNTRYTSELFTTMTPKEAVEVLAAIHNLKIKQVNNQVYLTK